MGDEIVESALASLTARTKAGRFRQLMPLIEAKIKEGVRHDEILAALNSNGFDLSENTYKTYLARNRKAAKTAQPQRPAAAPAAKTAKTVTVPSPAPVAEKKPGEPAKFTWNELKKQKPQW